MKTAKEILASGEPLPADVRPEDLPAAMEASDWGHGNGYIPDDWLRLVPLDRVGRRSIWMRFPPVTKVSDEYTTHSDGSLVELRAGREGDDAHVLFRAGDVITKEHVRALVDVLLTMKGNLE